MASSLFRRSLAILSAIVLVAALAFAAVGLSVLGAAYSDANVSSLARAAEALAAAFPPTALADAGAADVFAKTASSSGYRVTLVAPDGAVLADSEADPRTMENHASRPEVAAALIGRSAGSRRKSATVGEELLYAAAPLWAGDKPKDGGDQRVASDRRVAGVLRLALHQAGLGQALAPARWTFALATIVFAAAAIAAALSFSRMLARPLASLALVARAYGSGEATTTTAAGRAIRDGDPEEIRLLAATLDSMAAEIGKRMIAAQSQGRELEAILDAMGEAVLALDLRLRITIANHAAAALFSLRVDASETMRGSTMREGGGLLESTRSVELENAAAESLASGSERKIEISLYLPLERIFQAFLSPVRGPGTGPTGLVIVLNDITELRRLERVRRDFVANVSHELRTPVQLVKGFAETLSEGALGDPDQARRFVGIIGRNASRMENLINDLLSLASLEREGGDRIRPERCLIGPMLEAAREAIGPKAEARGTEVRITCGEALVAKVDGGLLEQAVINLIDNAVKYSPPATVVSVGAHEANGFLVIEVRDHGFGIPARDLPRIFERFYRVDKARSRELGGTGLGLAIVRHIALAHGGEVSVESWEGEGSTFSMKLPLSLPL